MGEKETILLFLLSLCVVAFSQQATPEHPGETAVIAASSSETNIRH